jgi:hypothetical protein
VSSIILKDGTRQEVNLDVTVYRAAADARVSVPNYINSRYETDAQKDGTAFEQLLADLGLFVRNDRAYGIRPPTMAEILDGRAEMQAGTVVRDASPASRIMFPAVIIEAVENKLRADAGNYISIFDRMIAIDYSIAGAKYEQPVLNYSKPEAARSQGIAQMALPASMLSITVSDVARKIPTLSLGMEISQEALQASSLDLVALAVTRQAETERLARVDEYIKAVLAGDADMGQAALPLTTHTVLDAAPVSGAITHKAWVKWLRKDWRKRKVNFVMCDLATALKIENRTGKPTIQTDDPKSPRINPTAEVMNPAWQNVEIFLMEDGVIDADKILGIDSRYALARARNIQADYTAVEEFVLRKSKAMRFDFGEIVYRLFDDASTVLHVA